METEEFASGDEEVLANAPPLSSSPRRTRSSTVRARAECAVSDTDSVSVPTFPPSGIPASVPDVPASVSSPADPPPSPSTPDVQEPVPIYNVNSGCLPPVISAPVPVRTVPADLRDSILVSHSSRSMVLTEKFIPLDGSPPVSTHAVFDFDFLTCPVLEDKVCFESVRAEHYADCRASSTASRLTPPVCSTMPGVSPPVDLPPLLPCVTPATFVDPVICFDATSAVALGDAFSSSPPLLDPMTFTADDVTNLLPSDFFELSDCDQDAFLRYFCGADYREKLARNVAASKSS